jgi:hypothetical protein
MPRSFADVYHDGPPPSVAATRSTTTSHPTSSSHIPPNAPALDTRRMSSSKQGMGRTRGAERGSEPKELPVGSEFAERTRRGSAVSSDDMGSPQASTSLQEPWKTGLWNALRRRSVGNVQMDEPSPQEVTSVDGSGVVVSSPTEIPAQEESRERRGSLSAILKKVLG